MEDCLLFLVEGETEKVFYKKLCDDLLTLSKKPLNFDGAIKIKSIRGIAKYEKAALIEFCEYREHVKRKYNCDSVIVVLGYDRDVFLEYKQKPPVNMTKVADCLSKAGAQRVVSIEAVNCIEDWFLCDEEGINEYLGTKHSVKRLKNGLETLKHHFKLAGKAYMKGSKTSALVEKLDIHKIACQNCEQIRVLCALFKLHCNRMK